MTRTLVQRPTGTTTCPIVLAPGSDSLRARPHISWDLGSCSSACGVKQLSRATRAWVRCPAISTFSPMRLGPCVEGKQFRQLSQVTLARVQWHVRLTGSPGQLVLMSEGPHGRPVLLGDSGSGRGLAGPTSSPGRLTLVSEGPPCRPALLGALGSGPRARGIDQLSRQSGLGPMACRVDQLSQRTHAQLRCPAGSTTCLVGPGAMFQCLRCRTALLCDSGPGQWPAISTSCTG